MTLKLNGSSSGYTAIDAPAAAGSNTLVLPADNGSANEVLKTDGSGNLDWVAQGSGLFSAYAIICDQKSQGSNAGGSTADTWVKRELNTEIVDSGNIVSISSDQFTLGAGTYLVKWRCPGYKTERHQTRLYNATDSSVTQDGFSYYMSNGANAQHDAKGIARFTISGSKAFEIQHNVKQAKATDGFGLYADRDSDVGGHSTVEIFTVVEIWKEA